MAVRVLSPADQRALDAALQHAALFGRDDQLPVVVRGQDRVKFLHNMLTQDVKGLAPGQVRPAALCDAQGGMVATATMAIEQDRIVLWVDRLQSQALAETLDKYVIMDDVELGVDESLALVGVVGPQAPDVLQRLGVTLPEPGQAIAASLGDVQVQLWRDVTGGGPQSPMGAGVDELLLSLARDDLGTLVALLTAHGATIGCHAAAEALRIFAGRPRLGIDVDDASLPPEAGLPATVNFRKGCYLGQEAIAIMTYRGQMRRHLSWVEPLGTPVPDQGWALRTVDGKRAGRMGSAVVLQDGRSIGLAMVQRKAFAVGAELVATGEDGASGRIRVLGTTVADVFVTPAAAAPAPTTPGTSEAPDA